MIYKKTLSKRILAGLLILMTLVMLPCVHVRAAGKQTLYIRDVRLFAMDKGTYDDARAWCESKGSDWHAAEGDLNEGGESALKSKVGVFLCYQTTDNKDEAITDIAVMNEQGNYSVGAYEKLLEEQRKYFSDLVNDSKQMLKEYRDNVQAGLPLALKAKDFMNRYKEDDSGEAFGDFLLNVSDEKLTDVLLQANGQVILMMQEQLALACDTGKSTWLDRMSRLGASGDAYEKLLSLYNNSESELHKKYKEQAELIRDTWGDIRQHINHVKKYSETNGLDKMNDLMKQKWIKEHNEDSECQAYVQESIMLNFLSGFKYGNGTLFDFFEQKADDISGDNIKKLYPMAASLSEGQLAGINESVSIFSLILDAAAGISMNGYQKGMAKTIDDNLNDNEKKDYDAVKQDVNDTINELNNIEPISIYNGVDREVFKGGVAVTSNAETFSRSSNTKWVDHFVESGAYSATAIALAVGSVTFATASIAAAVGVNYANDKLINAGITYLQRFTPFKSYDTSNPFLRDSINLVREHSTQFIKSMNENSFFNTAITNKPAEIRNYIREEGMKVTGETTKLHVLQGMKIGFAVLSVLMAVTDIVLTSITLYKYYNRDHLDIPKRMVDISESTETAKKYITYKNVLTQDDKPGDLNGDGGKQWLALYQTTDVTAGAPILAPENGNNYGFVIQKGSAQTPDGYTPIHLFGTQNTPQNLTFADGENGWSYNDKNGGTYLFFRRGSF